MIMAQRIPVAIIGVGGFGNLTLQALLDSPIVQLVGLADRDSGVAARAGNAARVPVFTDNRSLLAQTGPKIVYLAVPPVPAAEIVLACAERGIHVWKELPLARTLAEGVALVTRMERAKLKLAVGTQRRFAGGYRKAFELMPRLEEIFLARSHYLFNWGASLEWRGDQAAAGGGALMELGYHPIDLLVWLLGLPEEVYGFSAISSRKDRRGPQGKLQPIYDTDDTAAAVLRYGGGLMATVVTTRCSGPVSEQLCLHGRCGSLAASAETCLLRGPEGNVLENFADRNSPLDVFRLQAEAFAQAVMSDSNYYACSARENLLNLAVIESIYLSNRTSQPEHPLRLLKTHGLTAQECLIHRPPA